MKLIKKLFSFFWDRSLLIFAIIGGLNSIITWVGSFLLQNYAGWSLFAATALMFAVCSVASFYFNRKYSFKSNAPLGPSILRFTIIVTVCFLLSHLANYIVMPWLRQHWLAGMGDTLYSAIEILGVQVVFTLLNYLGQRLWAFRDNQTPDKDTSPPEATTDEAPQAKK